MRILVSTGRIQNCGDTRGHDGAQWSGNTVAMRERSVHKHCVEGDCACEYRDALVQERLDWFDKEHACDVRCERHHDKE